MSDVGQIERKTQDRVLKLLREQLGYEYLGNWEYREGNSNVEVELLHAEPPARGYDDNLINKAIDQLEERRLARWWPRSLRGQRRTSTGLLRYGVKVKPGIGEQTETVWLIDWKNPRRTTSRSPRRSRSRGSTPSDPTSCSTSTASPSGPLELKRSKVAVSEGIRQTIGNQKPEFIRPFFTTVQLVMAGNDVEGLRYGVIDTPEKYWLAWRKTVDIEEPLDRALTQLCSQGATPGAHPRLHGLRRRCQEDLPPQPVLRREGRTGAGRQA